MVNDTPQQPKPDKMPTDAAILKAFQKYEEAMNVAMTVIRSAIPGSSLAGDDVATITPTHARTAMWSAHEVYRRIALAAQERIDAKKESKK